MSEPEREGGGGKESKQEWQDDWHEWGCRCKRCRNLIAAMIAIDSDGEYFFSDEELEQLAERP